MTFDSTYNPFSLVGKTILITGASSGIGRATAIECSKFGAKCVITGRNEERLNETFTQMAGDGHQIVVADISLEEDIATLVEQCPILDGVVNNAGCGKSKPVNFISAKDMNEVFATNLFGISLLTKLLLKKKKIISGINSIYIFHICIYNCSWISYLCFNQSCSLGIYENMCN